MTTGRKRKVLHIGYDFCPFEAGRGGVIVYQWALMKALVKKGWDVSFLVGTKHTLSGRMRRCSYGAGGVKVVEVINSPRRHLDFDCNPAAHLVNATTDALAGDVIDEEMPDIVHIHDPRLFTASLVDVVKARRIPAVKTVHNYFDLCPQGELMFRGETLCTDFEEGRKCVECLAALPVHSFLKEKVAGTFRGTPVLPVLRRMWRLATRAARRKNGRLAASLPFPPESYARRRAFFMKRLQMLDAVHFQSGRSAEIFVERGLDRQRAIVIPASSDSLEKITRRVKRGREGYPVVFGYLTGESRIKGYEVLLDAFATLDQEKARLTAYGFSKPEGLRRTFGRLNVKFNGPYRIEKLNDILSEMDVGIVPSLWEEVFGIVGIEFLAAGIPVIGSRIGGIPEWLRDGANGYLFAAGDSRDLSAKMRCFIDDPSLVHILGHTVNAWKSMDDLASEMAELYCSLVSTQERRRA